MVQGVHGLQNGLIGTIAQNPGANRGPEARPAGGPDEGGARRIDRAEIAEDLRPVGDALADARAQLELAISAGAEALATLRDARGAPTPADGRVALFAYASAIEGGISLGAGLLRGENLSLDADSGAPGVAGVDVRLPEALAVFAQTGEGSFAEARAGAGALADRLSAALDTYVAAADGIDLHQRLVGRLDAALQSAEGPPTDADAARLAALSVSQGLAEQGEGFGARAESLLSLFRS